MMLERKKMSYIKSSDTRREIPYGSVVSIKEEKTENITKVTIGECIGRGGSSLVYSASLTRVAEGKEIPVNVIVKELFPAGLGVIRGEAAQGDDTALFVPEEKSELFKYYKEDFVKAQAELSSYYERYKDQTLPRSFLCGHANSTLYAVFDPGKGRLLSKIPKDSLALDKIALLMESVCKAIKKLHTKEKLYLDCKPDNFYYFFEENTLGASVYLFDFDSVVKLSDIKSGKNRICPFSPGWAAPEQIPSGIDGRYEDASLIGYHTDIFAIGEVFFLLLTGRKPEKDDLEAIKKDSFDWEGESAFFRNSSSESRELIRELEKEMLEPDPAKRRDTFKQYISVNALEKRFAILYGLTAGSDIRYAPIHESIEGLKKDIDKKLEKKTPKRIAVTVCALAAAAVLTGILITLGSRAAGKVVPVQAAVSEQIVDDHVIFELGEADHDYETGIENWKRLDYNRALRDISAAQGRVSGLVSSDGADAARINNSLGCLYLDMGRYEEAYDRLNDALVAFRSLYGEAAPETLASRFSVAQYDYLAGDTDTALKSLQQIIDTGDTGKSKALAAAVLNFQASVYDELGEYDKAITAYEKALDLYDDILSDGKLTKEFSELLNDPQLTDSEKEEYSAALGIVLTTQGNLASACIHAQDTDRAEELLKEAIDIAEDNVYIGRKNLITSRLYMTLAQSYEKSRKIKKGLDAVDLAERIQKNLFDFEAVYPGLVEVYEIYADLLMKDNNFTLAYQYYDDAVKLAGESFGQNHPKTAEALYRFGMSYMERELPAIAIDYFKQAIEIRKNILSYGNVKTIRYLEALLEAQTAAGDAEAAETAAELERLH